MGGMLFAALFGNRFDSDPKRFRMIAAYSLDAATALEILTPLFPKLFLPLAAVANAGSFVCIPSVAGIMTFRTGKNVSWLAASSTRAGIHRSLIKRENLADVTAKAGTQSIAASLLGTALGIGLSTVTTNSTPLIMSAFVALSAIHLYGNHKSLAVVQLNTLNQQRFHLLADRFLAFSPQQSLSSCSSFSSMSLSAISSAERYFNPMPYKSIFDQGCVTSLLETAPHLDNFFYSLERRIRAASGPAAASVSPTAESLVLLRLLQLRELSEKNHYFIAIEGLENTAPCNTTSRAIPRVLLFIQKGASPEDVLRAFYHVFVIRYLLHLKNTTPGKECQETPNPTSSPELDARGKLLGWFASEQELLCEAANILEGVKKLHPSGGFSSFSSFLFALRQEGWNMEHLFLESLEARFEMADCMEHGNISLPQHL